MASAIPPKRGVAYSTEVSLVSQADTKLFQDNPTLAAGDVIVIKDGVLDGNIDTLPVAVTSCTRVLTLALSADEMTADRVAVLFRDAAGAEWCDLLVTIDTVTTNQIDDLAVPGSVMGKSPATLAAADVSGNLPADVKAYTTQPTVTGATLHTDYDAAKTAAQAGNAMALTSGERNSVAAALLDLADGIETGLTARQALRLISSALFGEATGGGTTTITFRDYGDTKNRIVMTVDSDGNRSAVVRTVT